MHVVIHHVCGVIFIELFTKHKQDFFRKSIFFFKELWEFSITRENIAEYFCVVNKISSK